MSPPFLGVPQIWRSRSGYKSIAVSFCDQLVCSRLLATHVIDKACRVAPPQNLVLSQDFRRDFLFTNKLTSRHTGHTGETETIRNPIEIVRKGSISNHQIPSDFGWGLVKSILFEQARVDTSQYAPTKSLETSLFACGSRDRTTLATRSRPVHVDNKREHTHTHAHGMGSGGSAVDAMVIGCLGVERRAERFFSY